MSTPEYDSLKELFNEKISGLTTTMNAQFINVHERLDDIKTQTTKTNGKVSSLETDVTALKVNDVTHIINCPQTAKIESIEKDLNEYHFFKKYPKVLAGIILFIILGFGLTVYETVGKIVSSKKADTEVIHKIDSLNKK
jgi:hypothetical protein